MTNKTILVADDDEAIVDAIRGILEYSGHEVLQVYDGTSVMDAVKGRPDLIILDIAMGGHDGLTVCKQLKRQASTKNIPVLIISAGHNVHQPSLEAGADDFLAKPFEMEDLQGRVNTLLAKTSALVN
ncbi:response regulator transcription factor [Mucilaginibacter ginkgonis]|uniref:Response regulator transcription factor n=1 Tax=Mucilaginibacter ginkgonis TaxID=2682091 RepID=A0A6I4I279_9SPHI|nr:response regulator transcription factor [Mucilaginibacter ginkgonis]